MHDHALIVNPGGPQGSFARRVQESPAIAVEVLRAIRALVAEYEGWAADSPKGMLLAPAYLKAREIVAREYGPAPEVNNG